MDVMKTIMDFTCFGNTVACMTNVVKIIAESNTILYFRSRQYKSEVRLHPFYQGIIPKYVDVTVCNCDIGLYKHNRLGWIKGLQVDRGLWGYQPTTLKLRANLPLPLYQAKCIGDLFLTSP